MDETTTEDDMLFGWQPAFTSFDQAEGEEKNFPDDALHWAYFDPKRFISEEAGFSPVLCGIDLKLEKKHGRLVAMCPMDESAVNCLVCIEKKASMTEADCVVWFAENVDYRARAGQLTIFVTPEEAAASNMTPVNRDNE